MSLSPQSLVTGLPSLGSLPEVVQRIDDALADPQASMDDFGEIIKSDPVLTLRILKLANSSFYSFPTQIETVVQALTLIGVNQLRQLLLGSFVVKYFQNLTDNLFSMQGFWKHSIACGIAAKELSIQRRATEPERYFVAGLIHAIGRLVILLRAPQPSAEIMALQLKKNKPLYKIEREVLGFDHAAVGGELARAWQLPPYLATALSQQHTPSRTELFAEETSIVHAADIIVNAMQVGSSGERRVPPFDTASWRRLQIPEGSMGLVIRQVDRQSNDVLKVFID